jgi:putative ABC transport system permease protein
LFPGYYFESSEVILPDGETAKVKVDNISPDFPETAGLVLKRGQWLDQGPGSDVMVNESFARAQWGDEDPIGQMLKPTDHESSGWLVVGVVGDLRETLRDPPGFHIYVKESWYPPAMNVFVLLLNSQPNEQIGALMERVVYQFDPKIVVYSARSIEQEREGYSGFERFVLSILKVLSVIALLLTVVGLFSVLMYTVDRRMGEFGLRIALGATARDLARLIVRRGLLLTAVGIAGGIAGSLALTRFLQSLLFETPPYDPVVLGVAAMLLLFSAIIACIVPAIRATRADVAELLRSE